MTDSLRKSRFGAPLLDTAAVTGAGGVSVLPKAKNTFQATLSDTTTPVASIDIEVSNDEIGWIVMGTISLSGALDSDGFASEAEWAFVRANVTAISGTSATVTLTMGG